MTESDFTRRLERRLSREHRTLLRQMYGTPPKATDYARVFDRVMSRVPELEAEAARDRERAAERCHEISEAPTSLRATLIRGCPAGLLLALTRELIHGSFGARFDAPERSLELANVAVECAATFEDSEGYSAETKADLHAEALAYLANARRINSDLVGAGEAFAEAERLLTRGTRDRLLRADVLRLRGHLRFAEGNAEEAIRCAERDLRLRRLLRDPRQLGRALIDRGIYEAWGGSVSRTCEYLAEGISLVGSPHFMTLALHALAERLARDGSAREALLVIGTVRLLTQLVEGRKFDHRLRWIEGIAHRALGEYGRARHELEQARAGLLASGETLAAARLSLDLAAVAAARGETGRVRQLATEAHAVFVGQRTERRALAAFLAFHEAASQERLTEELAVRVADFLARYRYDRRLRFDPHAGAPA